jgi:hypothetical protein
MYYPQDMTREDIVSFELDMAEITIREEYDQANWDLDVAAQEAREEEVYVEYVWMVADKVGVSPTFRV